MLSPPLPGFAPWPVKRSLSHTILSALPVLLVVWVVGCASSPPAEETAEARAAALGTWEYKVEGIGELSRGTFYITVREDRLRAYVRDEQRGRFIARVRLTGSHMELDLRDLRISGEIEDDTFSGRLYHPDWEVSSSRQRRRFSRPRFTLLVARRTARSSLYDLQSPLDCPSILRESGKDCE